METSSKSPYDTVDAFPASMNDTHSPKRARLSSKEEYDKLTPGSEYIVAGEPDTAVRIKAYSITNPSEYKNIPDGMPYIVSNDPQKTRRMKPKYEGVGMGTQTLWDMTDHPAEQHKILAREYGAENVKTDPGGELYAEKEGKRYKPGSGSKWTRAGAFAAAEAAPVVGSGVGAVIGSPTVAGAVLGASAGAVAGKGVNDSILKAFGVYDRSLAEEAGGLGEAAAGGAIGELGGRAAIGAGKMAYSAAKGAAHSFAPGGAVPRAVASYYGAGADPEATKMAVSLAKQGVMVQPSAWLKEAPLFAKWVEQFDPAFRRQDVLMMSAKKHYAKSGENILKELGVPDEQLGKTAAFAKAGSAPQKAYQDRMVEEDAKLATSMAEAQASAHQFSSQSEKMQSRALAAVQENVDSSLAAAQKALDAGWDNLKATTKGMLGKFGADKAESGALMRGAATETENLLKAVSSKYGQLAESAYRLAGKEPVDISPVVDEARDLVKALPKEFTDNNPGIVQELTAFGSRGEPYKAGSGDIPTQAKGMTFEELHNLKRTLSERANWGTINSDSRNRLMKRFTGSIDNVLKSPEASPNLRAAGDVLTKADAFYSKNRPVFRERLTESIINAVKYEAAPNHSKLAALVFDGENDEMTKAFRKMVGKDVFNATVGADVDRMFQASLSHTPGQYDATKFAAEVLKRDRTGVLAQMNSPELAKTLRTQAARLEMVGGRLDINSLPGDTVATFLKRAADAEAQIWALAQHKPLDLLSSELKRIEAEFAGQATGVDSARKADPLRFLYDASMGATAAAKKILGDPDLIRAAAAKFGADSPEFALLRQAQAQRLLELPVKKVGTVDRAMKKTEEDVQALLFPGMTLQHAQTLLKEMMFLAPRTSDIGGGMAAGSRILHPSAALPGKGSKHVPDWMARLTLGSFYKFATNKLTSPELIEYVASGLERGTPYQKTVLRQELQTMLSALGAGTGAAIGASQ